MTRLIWMFRRRTNWSIRTPLCPEGDKCRRPSEVAQMEAAAGYGFAQQFATEAATMPGGSGESSPTATPAW